MARFVVRYTGAGPVPAADLDRLRQRARVVDAHGRTVLVEAGRTRPGTLVDGLEGWVATPETVVPCPTTRPTVPAARPAGRARARTGHAGA